MPSRPSTASIGSSGGGNARKSSKPPIQGTLRPQSAALLLNSPSRHVSQQAATVSAAVAAARANGSLPASSGNKGNVGASSDDLIRDLEHKVRKVVEQKRTESDKLRFALTRKREEVEKTKLILQDLIKESEALGLHYQPQTGSNQVEEQQPPPTHSVRARYGGGDSFDVDATEAQIVEEPGRLQPIASISRRPVYSKHSNINELEAKLEKRASETHQVHRRTLVLEHIKKRLLNEQVDVVQETNELKAQYADISHETQELLKKDIVAAEAVSQVQSRLAQQKEEIAANLRKYNREVAMRQKWAREKAKFEKYYNDQVGAEASMQSHTWSTLQFTQCTVVADPFGDEQEDEYRDAFLRIGFGLHGERIDPEEIIRICLSHEELKKELDAKHDEEVERAAQLRQSIVRGTVHRHEEKYRCFTPANNDSFLSFLQVKMRNAAVQNIPLSKRGTSQRLESKEIEISAVERSLATIVDQYMFVDQSVRPIKIGLQQVLQNVTNETVNVDDMDSLEKSLIESCEEMMRMIRESSHSELGAGNDEMDSDEDDNNATDDPVEKVSTAGSSSKPAVFSPENFTSPFNIRIPPKRKDPYFVPGINLEPAPKMEDHEHEEPDFDVMDRAMVKRISSVLLCTNTGKKTKVKGQLSSLSHL